MKFSLSKERLSWGDRIDRESVKASGGCDKCPKKVPLTPPSSPELSPPAT